MDKAFYKKYFEVEKDHWLMRVKRLIILDVLKKYSRLKVGESKILDFGCGSGYLVRQLAETGYQSFGLDNSVEAIEFGKERGTKNLAVADGDRIDFPDNYFDCVLLLDVLEHLENETLIIGEVERVLSPGGIAVITAPAFEFLWGVQDEISHHHRRYRLPELVRKIQSVSGFEIIKRSYFNTFLFIPIAAVRLASRFFKPKRQSDFEINNRLANFIFYGIFNLESKLLRFVDLLFGVSILAVLRKPNPHEKA